MDREKILQQIKNATEKQFLARVMDLTQRVARTNKPELTDFMDPAQQGLCDYLRPLDEGVAFHWWGGFEEAERKRLLITPERFVPEDGEFELAALRVEGAFDYTRVNHRDFLGAVIGLGLRREKVGDILTGEENAHMVVDRGLIGYITSQLDKVHRVSVKVEEVPLVEISPNPVTVKEIRASVASLRLDAVLAAGFGISRSESARAIRSERVRVNWRPVNDTSFTVSEKDVISLRGRGRMEVAELKGTTKKGRVSILLKRFK